MKLSFLSGRTDRLPAITYSPAKSVAHTVSMKTSAEWIYWVGLRCRLGVGVPTVYYSPDLMNLICWHVSLSVLLDPISHFFLLCCFLGNRSSWHIGMCTSCKSTRLRWLQLAWQDQINIDHFPGPHLPPLTPHYLTQTWTSPTSMSTQLVGFPKDCF